MELLYILQLFESVCSSLMPFTTDNKKPVVPDFGHSILLMDTIRSKYY